MKLNYITVAIWPWQPTTVIYTPILFLVFLVIILIFEGIFLSLLKPLLHGGRVLNESITSPIACVAYGSETHALKASASLLKRGLHAPAIRPPTVPLGTSRVRLALSAAHSDTDIDALVEAHHAFPQKPGTDHD